MDKLTEVLLSGRVTGLRLEVVADDGDDTGCLLGRVTLSNLGGPFAHARLYLTDKTGEDDEGNDVFSTFTVRVEGAAEADLQVLTKSLRGWHAFDRLLPREA